MLRRILVGFGDAFDAPVRYPKRADTSAHLFLIQRLDECANRNGFIIAMQEIDINDIGLQSLQTFAEINPNRFGREARNPGFGKWILMVNNGMTAFSD